MIAIDDILEDVARARNWSMKRRESAHREYLHFLRAAETTQITEDVDAIWHAHILHTRRYRQDCKTYVGHFVDHDPGVVGGGVSGGPCGGSNGPIRD